MGFLLGESGSTTIGKVAECAGELWGRQLVRKVSTATLHQIDIVLGRNFIAKYGAKQGIIVLGRVAPFGVGAVSGDGANATALAIRAARLAFGPASQSWPETWQAHTPECPARDTAGTRVGDCAGACTGVDPDRDRRPEGLAVKSFAAAS